MEPRALVRDIGQRRIGSPPALGRAAGNKKAGQHDHSADAERPETGGVYFRQGHVRRADLKRHDKIPKRSARDRHYTQEDHDGAVHRAERVIKLRRHFAVGHGVGPEEIRQPLPNYRQGLAGVGQLPTHDHHQAKAEEEKNETAKSVLDTDDFVVGRENVLTPPTELVMFVFPGVGVRIVMGFERSGSVHSGKSYPLNIERESLIAKSEFDDSESFREPRFFRGSSILSATGRT